MLTVKNVKTIWGQIKTIAFKSKSDFILDCEERLTLLPSVIDAHVHFRVPGAEHKEDWTTAAKAALSGGVTQVFDMPNNTPSCITKQRLLDKMKMIDKQLAAVKIPLRYHLYFGADQNHLDEIPEIKALAIGIKIYMGSSTGDLLMTDDQALERAFKHAGQENMMVAIHAEDEGIMQERKQLYWNSIDPAVHSKIRDRTAAVKAVKQALALSEKYNTKLFILHVTTKEELDLIREAKNKKIPVYAETTPHHLFLSENDYKKWGTLVQMNPPLRTLEDQEALWKGIIDGTIDTIGSDHAPHTLREKRTPYGQAPSGIPGIETKAKLKG